MEIIQVKHLHSAWQQTTIIKDVSFTVETGEIFMILGSSGCGKSTLMKHMIGLYKPVSGQIEIDGDDIVSAKNETRDRILRKIGVLYQSGALFGSMTVAANIRLPLEELTNLPPRAMDFIVEMKLKMVGLQDHANSWPSELSGGMQKRVAIARAMVMDPKILFLDEPSAGLDPITATEIDEVILGIKRALNVTFVIVTHDLSSICHIADRVIFLDKSTQGIIAEGNPQELANKSELPVWVSRFLGGAGRVKGCT